MISTDEMIEYIIDMISTDTVDITRSKIIGKTDSFIWS